MRVRAGTDLGPRSCVEWRRSVVDPSSIRGRFWADLGPIRGRFLGSIPGVDVGSIRGGWSVRRSLENTLFPASPVPV